MEKENSPRIYNIYNFFISHECHLVLICDTKRIKTQSLYIKQSFKRFLQNFLTAFDI